MKCSLCLKSVAGLLTLLGMLFSVERLTAESRENLSLDGTWQFATDPDSIGETEGWFQPGAVFPKMPREGYAKEANGTIQVPGIWDDQGYGTMTDKLHHNFIGKGWYRKTVKVPSEWRDKNIYLVLGGISRYAKLWVNGKSAGKEALGCIGPHEWEISSLLTPGKEAVLTLVVDSKQRWEKDALLGCSSIIDYMQISWGGIWSHITLEVRPKCRIDSFSIRSDIKKSECKAECLLLNETGTAIADTLKLEVLELNGSAVAVSTINIDTEKQTKNQFEATIPIVIPNLKLWTTDKPNLYYFKVSLCKGNKVLDELTIRHGVREIRTEGHRLLLNGKDVVLRGYGDDHIYPVEFSMPSDKQVYLDRLRIIKAYGFNHVRHHSTILPHEYYEACDELGILSTAEYLIGYPHQLPGEGNLWKSNVPEGTDPNIALNFYCENWKIVVKDYRHHPSILCWVGGNELVMLGRERWEAMPLRHQFKKIANDLDPDRPYLDCDGDWKSSIGNYDRDTQDIYIVLFDEWTNPIVNGEKKFAMSPLKKPSLSHESGNYITFVRMDQIDLFKSYKKKDGSIKKSDFIPFWLTPGQDRLKKLGLYDEVDNWSDASEMLYYTHHKYNVENIRLNPTIVGYHWWLIQDYWTTSNGLVDYFFRPKRMIPFESVRMFNQDAVLLQKGLARTYRSGDSIQIKNLISNFSENAISGTLTEKFTYSDKTAMIREVKFKELPSGKLSDGNQFEMTVPEVTKPVEAVYSVEFKTTEGRILKNNWKTWLFPKESKPVRSVTIYSDMALDLKSFGALPIPTDGDLPTKAVYFVSTIDNRIAKAMVNGAGVVLCGPSDLLSGISVKYQQSWWKGGDSPDANNCGTYLYQNDVTSGMSSGNWCDIQWCDLIENATKYNVEGLGERPEIYIRALPSIVRIEDTAILFRVGVGKGSLIVDGLNHKNATGKPENEWLITRMIDVLTSNSAPKVVWPVTKFLEEVHIPQGTIAGYRRILTPAFSWTFWKSYKSATPDSSKIALCRQRKGSSITWETARVGNLSDTDTATATFIFAGGFGFALEPQTEGFAFSINGKEVFNFDLPKDGESASWQSKDGSVVMRYEKYRKEPQDTFGFFRITIANSLLRANSVQEFKVRALGDGSQRWFGINPILNMSEAK